jgi:CHAD domain-containing protein
LTKRIDRQVKLNGVVDVQELCRGDVEERTFVSTYHDTDDFRLARAGLTLRRRVENGRSTWELKLPRNGARVELETLGGPVGPPGELLELLAAVARQQELAPVLVLRTRRRAVHVDEAGLRADVMHDAVDVVEGQRVVSHFDELEFELLRGDEDSFQRLVRKARKRGAVDAAEQSKLLRALRVERSRTPRKATPAEHVRALLQRRLAEIRSADPRVRVGDDIEAVHDLRVALRRTRALLSTARPLLDRAEADRLRSELAWVGRALGPVRDLEVLIDGLDADVGELDGDDRLAAEAVVRRLRAERAKARAAAVRALRSDRYFVVLRGLEELARDGVVGKGPSLRKLARREFRKLRRTMKEVAQDSTDEALHRARIRAKRARYSGELAESSAKCGREFVTRAKQLQDVAGRHQDAVVAEARLRSLLPQLSAPEGVAIGRLVERQRARRRAARAELPRAWRRLKRSGRRAWS